MRTDPEELSSPDVSDLPEAALPPVPLLAGEDDADPGEPHILRGLD